MQSMVSLQLWAKIMKSDFRKPILISILIFVIVSACGLFAPRTQEQSTDALFTQAAQTVQVRLTQQVFETMIAQLTQISPVITSTSTETASQPTGVYPTPFWTSTPVPPTTVPGNVSPPTATQIPVPCNKAVYIKDVTVADGSVFAPEAEFTKVWRLQNAGSCNWNSNYALVFVSGDRMDGSKNIPLAQTVKPGEKVDLEVEFTAPEKQGRYRGYWMLSDASGRRFGIGRHSDESFWVDIKVMTTNKDFAYDLAVNLCTATWRSSAGSLACPGDPSSAAGSIVLLEQPRLENGRHEDEPSLWMRPEATRGGWISGVYPPYKVKANDHFLADIGCLYDNQGCDVTFSLGYQISGGQVKNLGSWHEVYEGQVYRVNVDLSSLAGNSVQLVLGITNNGKPGKANALWLAPSVRQQAPPTATSSPTPTFTATPTLTPTPTATLTPTSTTNPQELIAVQAARQKLAADLGLELEQVRAIRVEYVEWRDSCLGLQISNMDCILALIPGYRIILEANGNQYEARTSNDGAIVFWFEL